MSGYISLSRAPRGSFEWAMDQVRAGNEVRREAWPIEVEPRPTDPPGGFVNHARIWHLYDVGGRTICKGFNSGVCGADNDSWGDLGMDSSVYTPNVDDIIALDWQFVSEVTPEQIAERDANRVERYPNESVVAFERYLAKQDRKTRRLMILLGVLGVALAWAVYARAGDEACLLLRIGHGANSKMVPIATPFPSLVDCEKASAAMVDGKTVRIGVCLPLAVYDCRLADPVGAPVPTPVPVPQPAPKSRDRSA